MKVLVDTSVWSLALRRKAAIHPSTTELENLILDGRACIIGPVRQELLSGVRVDAQFELLKEKLRAFPDIQLQAEDHEEAARFFNTCRTHGVQGSNTDFLICAVAVRRAMPIFTTDQDFERFSHYIPLSLFTN